MKKLTVLFIVLISFAAQFVNLFGYPVIEGDEGVYVAQGWWLTHFGQITPYTYWYDHFPLGWLQIGLWQHLTGGPFIFGLAIFSGRVFISLLLILTNLLVFRLTHHLSQSKVVALLAVIIFSLTPLALGFHRQVYLDNISVFWLMASLVLLFTSQNRLTRYIFSALTLGIATLSKESAIIFLPGFLVYFFLFEKSKDRIVPLGCFLLTYFFLIAYYPLLAILKGEFFFGPNHVSLLQTVLFQASRGSGGDFLISLNSWLQKDFLFIITGVWGISLNLFFSDKKSRLISIFALSYVFFLIRGGIVLDFYIIPLVPFIAITTALSLKPIAQRIPSKLGYLLLIILVGFLVRINLEKFTSDYTKNQRDAVAYIKASLPKDANIATDFAPWMDLKFTFPHTEAFYNIENDPSVPKSIDYIILNSGMSYEITSKNYQVMKNALDKSVVIRDFSPLAPKDTPLGDKTWLQILKVNP